MAQVQRPSEPAQKRMPTAQAQRPSDLALERTPAMQPQIPPDVAPSRMPMPMPERQLTICPECDALYRLPPLRRGEVARCRRCDHVLSRRTSHDVDQGLALVLACAIFFVLANITPILKINVAGTQTEVTIWGAAQALGHGWISLAAVVLLTTMALVPALQVAALLWVLLHAKAARSAPAFRELSWLLQALQPWSMTEVFLLGALVAVVKLSHWLPLATGTGLWSLAAFTILFTWLGRFDRQYWWALGSSPWK